MKELFLPEVKQTPGQPDDGDSFDCLIHYEMTVSYFLGLHREIV